MITLKHLKTLLTRTNNFLITYEFRKEKQSEKTKNYFGDNYRDRNLVDDYENL